MGLGGSWARYLAAGPLPLAAGDLWTWTRTTMLRSSLLSLERPWITFAAARWLREFLAPSMSVFEWGAGGSTLFLARHAGRVLSVEHHEGWTRAVRDRLQQRGITNAEVVFAPPRPVPSGLAVEDRFRTSDPQYAGWTFEPYVTRIRELEDDSLDLVVVDGRARLGCALEAGRKLKPGGALLLDDADRTDTAPAVEALSGAGWRVSDFDGPGPASLWPAFWRTSVFWKPVP